MRYWREAGGFFVVGSRMFWTSYLDLMVPVPKIYNQGGNCIRFAPTSDGHLSEPPLLSIPSRKYRISTQLSGN